MLETLQQIVDLINQDEKYWAMALKKDDEPPKRDEYLIIFSRRRSDIIYNLSLMGDLGITWKPHKPEDTPCYCTISIDDPQQAARQMQKLSDAWEEGQLPMDLSGEDMGVSIIQ